MSRRLTGHGHSIRARGKATGSLQAQTIQACDLDTDTELQGTKTEVLGQLAKNGEPIAISYGKKKEKIAAIIPYHQLKPTTSRELGLMRGRASCVVHDDFALSDEEVLGA